MGGRELPEGWEWVDLKKFVFFQEGPGIRKWQFKKTGIKLLNVGNLVNGALKLDKTERHVDGEEVAQKYSHFLLDPDDIVMASSGVTWGKTSVISKEHLPLMLNTSTIRLRSLDEIKLDKKYLQIFINSRLFKNQIDKLITGSAQPNFGSSHLKQVKLLLPPLHIQRQIVAVLEKAEAVKRQRQEADALTGALLQSVFLEMFGNPENNSKKWELVKLGDVSKVVVSYVGPINQYFCEKEEGVPLLNTTNIKPDGLISNDFRYVSREFHKKNKKSQLHPGDIIVARHGKSGSATIIPDLLLEAQSINNVIIKRSTELEPDYVRHLFNLSTHSQKMLGLKTGTVQKIINTKQLADFKIPLPPLALQQQFAQIVENVERIRERQVASGKEIEGLCEGLMARAFTGELAT
jgi:type I restriction enzyme S subunit